MKKGSKKRNTNFFFEFCEFVFVAGRIAIAILSLSLSFILFFSLDDFSFFFVFACLLLALAVFLFLSLSFSDHMQCFAPRFYDVNCQKIRPYQTDAAHERARPQLACTLILRSLYEWRKSYVIIIFPLLFQFRIASVLRKNMKWHCHANRTDNKNQIA